MSIALANSPETPKYTTVSGLVLSRLGQFPTLRAMFAETTDDVVFLTVTRMEVAPKNEETDPDVYTAVFVDCTNGTPANRVGRSLLGEKLYLKGTDTEVGVVVVHDINTDRIQLQTAPTTSLVGSELQCAITNAMGVPTLRPSANGRSWEAVLPTADSAARAYMLTLMGTFHVHAAMSVLTALGHTHTVEEVAAAIQALPDNIESMLASTLEQIELDRRARTLPAAITVLGEAP